MTELGFPNWFKAAGAETNFEKFLSQYAGQPLKCLQLGAYTGDATDWLFKNLLTHPDSSLIDVDTWEGSDEVQHKPLNWDSVEEYYDARNKDRIESGQLIKYKGTTDEFFASDLGKSRFHFIYVDADHTAAQVLKDGINSLYRIVPGGILAFDDYMWSQSRGFWNDPKPAVDAIWLCHYDKVHALQVGYQVWLQKDRD